tara:strand:+ start:218 stop:481 length:264 start_codon:yes stop_codon:yes gene_type:complete
MKNNKYEKLKGVIKNVANKTKKFTVDELRLCADILEIDQPEYASTWSNILRGSVADGDIEMLPTFRKSFLRKSNGAARRVYRRKVEK